MFARNIYIAFGNQFPTSQGSWSYAPYLFPTITFTIENKYLNDPSFSLIAISNSTGTFTYSSSNTAIASISTDKTVILKTIGNVTITATQSSSSTYIGSRITASFVVLKNKPTISNFPTSITKSVADISFMLTPSSDSTGAFTYSSSNTNVADISMNSNIVILKGILGNTIITATQTETSTFSPITISTTINVSKINPSLSNFNIENKYLGTSNSFQITSPSTLSPGSFNYTSSDTNIAIIDISKVILVSIGVVTITATQTETLYYQSQSILSTFTVSLPVTATSQYYHDFYTYNKTSSSYLNRSVYNNTGNLLYSENLSFGGSDISNVFNMLEQNGSNPYTIGITDYSSNKIKLDLAYCDIIGKAVTKNDKYTIISYINTNFEEPGP